MGYYRAGFDILGVDINPQKNYPFDFIEVNAITFLKTCGDILYGAEAIHASPPCQAYSRMTNCRPGLKQKYSRLIEPVRELLISTGLPYVIENVEDAPLVDPITLCGFMFGYELYRHRLFESNFRLMEPLHPEHVKPASKAGHWTPGTVMSVSGHIAPIKLAREVMDIDWTNREELAEAVPPYYTSYIGDQLMRLL